MQIKIPHSPHIRRRETFYKVKLFRVWLHTSLITLCVSIFFFTTVDPCFSSDLIWSTVQLCLNFPNYVNISRSCRHRYRSKRPTRSSRSPQLLGACSVLRASPSRLSTFVFALLLSRNLRILSAKLFSAEKLYFIAGRARGEPPKTTSDSSFCMDTQQNRE